MKKVVLLNGAIGVGKSYTADYFVKNHGFIKLSYAEHIKKLSEKVFKRLVGDDTPNKCKAIYGTPYEKEQRFLIKNPLYIPQALERFVLSLVDDFNICPYKDYDKIVKSVKLLTNMLCDNHNVSGRVLMQFIGTEIFRYTFSPDFNVTHVLSQIRASAGNNFIIDDYRFPNEYDLLEDEFKVLAIHIQSDEGQIITHASESQSLYFDRKLQSNNYSYQEKLIPIIKDFVGA